MTDKQMITILQELEATVAELRSLLAWEALKRAEARPGDPPGFIPYDPAAQDIKHAYSLFLAKSLTLHHILKHPADGSATSRQREEIRRKLIALEDEFRQLDLSQRFINSR